MLANESNRINKMVLLLLPSNIQSCVAIHPNFVNRWQCCEMIACDLTVDCKYMLYQRNIRVNPEWEDTRIYILYNIEMIQSEQL